MIIVRVELWSAVTGEITELARMRIANVGGSDARGDYEALAFRGRSKAELDRGAVQRRAKVADYPRLALHVWCLVSRSLAAMGYR